MALWNIRTISRSFLYPLYPVQGELIHSSNRSLFSVHYVPGSGLGIGGCTGVENQCESCPCEAENLITKTVEWQGLHDETYRRDREEC